MANGSVAKTFETEARWTIKGGAPDGTDRVDSRKGTFPYAADADSFIGWLQTLPRDKDAGAPALGADGRLIVPSLDYVYAASFYGYDLKFKARLRPTVSVESPWISRDGIRINLATGERIGKDGRAMKAVPIGKCLNAINNHFAEQADLELEPKGNYVVARRMLLESKKAREDKGKLVTV